MEPLLAADQPDEGKILAQIDRVAQARAELEKANARMLLGLRRVLTPDQWKTLQADEPHRHYPRFGADREGNPDQIPTPLLATLICLSRAIAVRFYATTASGERSRQVGVTIFTICSPLPANLPHSWGPAVQTPPIELS